MIKVSINVNSIDKSRLYEGKKGKYLNICLIETPDSKYGNDFMVVEDVTKEEREAGKKGNILGDAKIMVSKTPRPKEQFAEKVQAEGGAPKQEEPDLDCPF